MKHDQNHKTGENQNGEIDVVIRIFLSSSQKYIFFDMIIVFRGNSN